MLYPFLIKCSLHTLSFLRSLVCCLFLIEGFVSNEWDLFRFFVDEMAAAAAIPVVQAEAN